MTARALVVVDVQNDFCEGGSLAVPQGSEVARRIGAYLDQHRGDYDLIVFSKDWHIDPGSHFSQSPNFVDSFPPHCLAETIGAQLHEQIESRVQANDVIVKKGEREAAFSAFDGVAESSGVPLLALLSEAGIAELDVCGLATDFCVLATALQAHEAGFATRVLASLSAPVTAQGGQQALDQLFSAGVSVVSAL